MKLFDGVELEGDICPECVLAGPAGAAAKIRDRLVSLCRSGGASDEEVERASWIRLLDRRARLLEGTLTFPLAVRQAAVRETRERR